jgi:purine-cytosine permease-like protein
MRRHETEQQEAAGWSVIIISGLGAAVLLGLCAYIRDYGPFREWIGIITRIMLPWLFIAAVIYLILRLFGVRPTFGKNKNQK